MKDQPCLKHYSHKNTHIFQKNVSWLFSNGKVQKMLYNCSGKKLCTGQNIAEQNGGIDIVAPNRLHCDLKETPNIKIYLNDEFMINKR